jgi:hypothetical protein
VTRFCAGCKQQRPLREFDLGGGQLSTTCLGCADERLRTEDHRARRERNEQIAALEKRRRELIAALVKIDAEIADLTVRARPTPVRIVIDDDEDADDSEADDAFSDDSFGADLDDRARDEMS